VRESTLWLIDLIAAVLLAATVLIHIYPFSSLVSGIGLKEAVTVEAVLSRGKSVHYLVTYLIMVTAASYHPFYRLRLMLLEYYGGDEFREKLISAGCLICGLILFVVGLYSTIALYMGW